VEVVEMKPYQRVRLSERMKRLAEENTCPVCGRGAALVIRLVDEEHRTWCRWIDLRKCESTPANDTRIN
jgi:hypothetical protein